VQSLWQVQRSLWLQGDATAEASQQGVGAFVDGIDRFVHAIEDSD
jgi:nitrate/nitrite-specific signal transduction histidine kinase